MSLERLRFSPEILRRLGEELVPHPDLGILELVRNSFDADATSCEVYLDASDEPGGTVVVSDNGDGMEPADIRSGWLLLGRSTKSSATYTRSGRRRVGEKGLGRLAALRMGSRVLLTTVPRASGSHTRHTLQIEWSRYDQAEAVEDVELILESADDSEAGSGTRIEIRDLHSSLRRSDVRRLARSLVMLTGPFPAENDFRATLHAPEFQELEELVDRAYFSESEYHLKAYRNHDGTLSVSLYDWNGTTIAQGTLPKDGQTSYQCPVQLFELYMFNLSRASFDLRHSSEAVKVVQDWLREVGGVHVYHRGLRVSPYGDSGNDWLDMNLRRARSPELRPSTNNSVGRVLLHGDDTALVPKTDRTGFVENFAFEEARRLCTDVLDWAANERLRIRDADRAREKKAAPTGLTQASAEVLRVVDKLPASARPEVQAAVARYQSAVDRRIRSVQEDVLLYRTLGTVGTLASVFAHESLRPIAAIQQLTENLHSQLRRDLPGSYEDRYSDAIARIRAASETLRSFSEVPLRMLARNKRRHQRLEVGRVCRAVLRSLEPYLNDLGIELSFSTAGSNLWIVGNVTSLEAAFANIVANAAHFIDSRPGGDARQIDVLVQAHVHQIEVNVADTGPGIIGIELDDIWLPGRSTRKDGSGLGLTIAMDSVRDLGGDITVRSPGRMRGAEFQIRLPYAPDHDAPELPLDAEDL